MNRKRQASRAFRSYYSESDSEILRYFSGRNGQRLKVKFICHCCGEIHIVKWRTYRYMFDLLCTQCLRKLCKKRGVNLTGEGRDSESKKWDNEVKIRAGFKCELTGKKGKVTSHHIKNWADHPNLRYDPSNGICMLSKLHTEFHSLYGKNNTTPEQLSEFTNQLINT